MSVVGSGTWADQSTYSLCPTGADPATLPQIVLQPRALQAVGHWAWGSLGPLQGFPHFLSRGGFLRHVQLYPSFLLFIYFVRERRFLRFLACENQPSLFSSVDSLSSTILTFVTWFSVGILERAKFDWGACHLEPDLKIFNGQNISAEWVNAGWVAGCWAALAWLRGEAGRGSPRPFWPHTSCPLAVLSGEHEDLGATGSVCARG